MKFLLNRIGKGSAICSIDNILSPSTIHYHLLSVTSHSIQQSKYFMLGTKPVVSYFQINKVISDLKIVTKILQGVTPLPEVCIYPLTEGNNWNFARGSSTEFFLGKAGSLLWYQFD